MTRPTPTRPRVVPRHLLRRLAPADSLDCAEFDANAGGPRPFSARELRAFLREEACYGYVIEDRRGNRAFPPIAGYLLLWVEADTLRLLRFTVRPACRGVGFGRALMAGLVLQLGVHRRDTLTAYVPEEHTPGLTFLRAFGWKAVPVNGRMCWEGLIRMEYGGGDRGQGTGDRELGGEGG